MANMFQFSNNVNNVMANHTTPTTPTLTPTTLKNLTDHILENRSIPLLPVQHQHQAGFMPPIIHPTGSIKSDSSCGYESTMDSDDSVSQSYSIDLSNDHSDSSLGPDIHERRQVYTRVRKGKEEKMTPEEREKLMIKRQRNKEAAARCRKRRSDHTNNLLTQTSQLEEEKRCLQREIELLERQKSELESYLKAHKADKMDCKLFSQLGSAKLVKSFNQLESVYYK